MSKIKFPVCQEGTDPSARDSEGQQLFYVPFHVRPIPEAKTLCKEIIHCLNDHQRLSDGYGVAVKALREIIAKVSNVSGKQQSLELFASTLVECSAKAAITLGDLGELDEQEAKP